MRDKIERMVETLDVDVEEINDPPLEGNAKNAKARSFDVRTGCDSSSDTGQSVFLRLRPLSPNLGVWIRYRTIISQSNEGGIPC